MENCTEHEVFTSSGAVSLLVLTFDNTQASSLGTLLGLRPGTRPKCVQSVHSSFITHQLDHYPCGQASSSPSPRGQLTPHSQASPSHTPGPSGLAGPTLNHSGAGQRPGLSLCAVLCSVARFPELHVDPLLTKPRGKSRPVFGKS